MGLETSLQELRERLQVMTDGQLEAFHKMWKDNPTISPEIDAELARRAPDYLQAWSHWRENLCKALGVANMLDATRRLAQLTNAAGHRQKAEDYYQDAWEKQPSYTKALQRLETNGLSEEARAIRAFVASLAYSHNEAMLALAVMNAPINPNAPGSL